jgi:hypothetical protein
MADRLGPPDAKQVLGKLKAFQRLTAEHAFRRLYLDEDGSGRFLVADEAGLGKTLVAKGVIAKAIEHLWDKTERIDIVYICSNADIARQNMNRLRIRTGDRDLPCMPWRLTLLALSDAQASTEDASARVNYVALTPGTSLYLKSQGGLVEERAFLYWLLKDAWGIEGAGSFNMLCGAASKRSFQYHRKRMKGLKRGSKSSIIEVFQRRLSELPELRERFLELADKFRWVREPSAVKPDALRRARDDLIGELREKLALVSIEALEPDLVILDEFQRFKDVLDPKSTIGALAHKLLEYADANSRARVLLLSATPYKMYSLWHESADHYHYSDLLRTLEFLFKGAPDGQARIEEVRLALEGYGQALYRLEDDWETALADLNSLKERLVSSLRQVMSRTERLAVSENRSGMLCQAPPRDIHVEEQDLRALVGLEKLAGALKHPDVAEYWKAAPYLLSFMDDYKLKTQVKSVSGETQRTALLEALRCGGVELPWAEVEAYRPVDPSNARLRSLIADVIEGGAWRLLWIPPSFPYYQAWGAFAAPELQNLTKQLVFSAWQVVPKAVSTMLSYEAERRMVRLFEDDPKNSREARRARSALLRFGVERGDEERLTGMPVLGMLYPSTALAREGDPLAICAQSARDGILPSLEDVLAVAASRFRALLAPLAAKHDKETAPIDESWYWAAPIVLDALYDSGATIEWFEHPNLASLWGPSSVGNDEESRQESQLWKRHVDYAREVFLNHERLDAFPDDLYRVLALMSVGGPAVCAHRALTRGTAPLSETSVSLRDAAAEVAWAFRSLFNQPEVMALLRGLHEKENHPYWRQVLEYCAAGNLQATLDEYVHMLRESLGVADWSLGQAVPQITEVLTDTIRVRASTLATDRFDGIEVQSNRPRLRTRFASHFGRAESEDGNEVTRPDQVRHAFNSPFWPFVLVTTSVGQEGLDFHPYCHSVIHWDLPSNPVDLEQREGRVHRFKGHAIRKNVARRHGEQLRRDSNGSGEEDNIDPWERLFAAAERDSADDPLQLKPYWLYPIPQGAYIERHVPAYPLSRDFDRLAELRRTLVLYRMVFGQPRQEELVEYLLQHIPSERRQAVFEDLRIDLSPPTVG